MCVAGPASAREKLNDGSLIRVASKYPGIAKDYFYNKKHQTVEIIKLNGSVELAVLEEICPLSARVVVNEVSMKMQHERITKLIRDLKKVIPDD